MLQPNGQILMGGFEDGTKTISGSLSFSALQPQRRAGPELWHGRSRAGDAQDFRPAGAGPSIQRRLSSRGPKWQRDARRSGRTQLYRSAAIRRDSGNPRGEQPGARQSKLRPFSSRTATILRRRLIVKAARTAVALRRKYNFSAKPGCRIPPSVPRPSSSAPSRITPRRPWPCNRTDKSWWAASLARGKVIRSHGAQSPHSARQLGMVPAP